MITEAQFQRQITDLADITGWAWYHTHDSRKSPVGYPDLTLLRGASVIILEVKTETGKLRAGQQDWIDRWAQVPGVIAAVVRPADWERIAEWLR